MLAFEAARAGRARLVGLDAGAVAWPAVLRVAVLRVVERVDVAGHAEAEVRDEVLAAEEVGLVAADLDLLAEAAEVEGLALGWDET